MNTRKTQRKNKTKQIIKWPSQDSYFTIDGLIEANPHMLTSSGSDITLRVRLNKAINEENLVVVIGQRNTGKGRPQLAFAVRPLKQTAIDKAKADGIMLDMPKIITVMEVNTNQTVPVNPTVSTSTKTVNA